jgi:hypothetical protein
MVSWENTCALEAKNTWNQLELSVFLLGTLSS